MSYCRFSPESNVYLYPEVDGGIVCCACRLKDDPFLGPDPSFAMPDEALAHLEAHMEAGHPVPDYAIERLRREIDT